MKKYHNLPSKNIHSNNSSGKPFPNTSNYSRNQSPYNSSYRGRSLDEEIHEISHKIDIVDQLVKIINIEITIHDQIQTEEKFHLPSVLIQNLRIDNIPTNDHEIHQKIEIETILTIEIEVIQIIEINIIHITDQEIIHTIKQIIKDPMIITKTDQELTHKIQIQTIAINKEIIPNLLILKTGIEVTHQNIKDKSIKYKQLNTNFRPPGIADAENNELQFNHINCELTHSESD